MINRFRRLKLIQQIACVILCGFIISYILSLYLLSYDNSNRLYRASVNNTVGRIISISHMIESTPASMHRQLIKAVRSRDLQLSLTRKPEIKEADSSNALSRNIQRRFKAQQFNQVHLTITKSDPILKKLHVVNSPSRHFNMMGNTDMMSSHMDHRRFHRRPQMAFYQATINGSIQLTNQQWLNFSSGIEKQTAHWSSTVMAALVVIMLLTIGICLIVIQKALLPIGQLGRAAQSFAHNKQIMTVNHEHSPYDLQPTISAFNDMQHQITDFIADRTKLLAAISHDLRTPLTSLRLRLEFIEESEDKQQMLATLNNMEKMLTETMRFSKNDAQIERRQSTNIDSLLQTIVDEYQEKEHQIDYQSVVMQAIKIPILNTRRMCENLINNAIQYAGNDITITLAAQLMEQQLVLTISDNGVGIPEHQYQEAIKPFTRLSEARDTTRSNVGLGLSITHALITAYGGSLTLKPNQPHGLVATLIMPLDDES